MARLIDSIFGHEDIWQTLMGLVHKDRLPHAMAFTGTPGVGKRMMAWALAQALVCEREQKPCGQCPSCHRIELHQSENVLFIEPEGTMIKLEAAEEILQFLSLQQIGAARMVIIDQAQLLNPQAGNALLKIVEEPPPNCYFVLITPEISQLLPTLRSRSQVLRFSPLKPEVLQKAEKLPPWMVRSSRGSFENLEVFRDPENTELRKTVLGFLTHSFAGERAGLQYVLEASKEKESGSKVIRMLQQLLRDWVLMGSGELLHEDLRAELAELPEWEPRSKAELLRYSFQMEMDFLGHIDRSLIFENFFYRVRPQVR